MDSPQLPNYLLSNRKRLGLSQADVAYLLRGQSPGKVCRHERFQAEPSFKAALGYEAIYKTTDSELFNGLYRKVEHDIAARAKMLLAEKVSKAKPTQRNLQKRKVLAELASLVSDAAADQYDP